MRKISLLDILRRCQNLRDLARFANRHQTALTNSLEIDLKRSPCDAELRDFFPQRKLRSLCRDICYWNIARISGSAEGLEQPIGSCKASDNSVELTANCLSTFISPVTLNSAALGLAISQAFYAANNNHERAMLKQLLRAVDLQHLLIQLDSCTPRTIFRQLQEQTAGFLLTFSANKLTMHRQITRRIGGSHQILLKTTGHDLDHSRNITWTLCAKEAQQHVCQEWVRRSLNVRIVTTGQRDVTPLNARHLILTSMTITPEAMLQLVRDRRIFGARDWIRNTRRKEDSHHYQGNGSSLMGNHKIVALNLLRLRAFDRHAAACRGSPTRSW